MSIPFYASIDLNKNEIQNARVQNLASAPSSPVEGQIYHNTTDHHFYFYTGSGWQDVTNAITFNSQTGSYYLSRTNHTGTQAASTISDFDTQVRTSRLDQMAAPTASVNLNSQKITNVADGTSSGDAVNLGQLQSIQAGLDPKGSVRVATTANITLSGTQTIDGVAVIAGDRVLVKNQSTGADNGIYVVAAGAWSRATDANTSAEVTTGLYVFVAEGTTNGDSAWVLTTDDPITLGTTALVFTQFSGAGQITAGAALTKTGNTLDVAVDNSTIEVSSDALRVKALGITDAHVAAANKDGLAATASMRTLGTGSQQAAAGDHTHSIYMRKYSTTLSGGSTSEVVTHNLNSRAVIVDVSLVGTPYTQVMCEIEKTSVNTVTIKMASSIASTTYLVTIIG